MVTGLTLSYEFTVNNVRYKATVTIYKTLLIGQYLVNRIHATYTNKIQ